MRRKLFIVLAILAVVMLAIAACQTAAPEEEAAEEEAVGEEAAEEEAAEETDETFFIGMVQHSSIPFTQQMRAGFDAACEDLPIECEYNAPETVNPETAIGMFEAMVQKGADAIVLNAAPPEAWETVVADAVEQGVIVNAIDNFPPAETGFGVFVSPSNEGTAYALANEFFDQLRSQGVESGEIVWGICAPGYVGQEERADGWQRACDDQDDFTCVGRLDTGHSVELDYAFWETTILQYPDAVGFAGNCAFDGPNLARLKLETGGDWGIATFDLEPETLVGIQDGTITVAMGINPWLNAYLATRLAYEHLVSGEPIAQGQIDSGPELVTAENVDDFLAREDDLDLKHEWHLDLMEESFVDLDSMIEPFSE